MSVVLTKAGENLTLCSSLAAGKVTLRWKAGAIMAHCSRVEVADPAAHARQLVIRFDCPASGQDALFARVTRALASTGPVNLGLTAEKGDGLRLVYYFPDERTAQRRMHRAIQVAEGQP